jgi:hypothetical protein
MRMRFFAIAVGLAASSLVACGAQANVSKGTLITIFSTKEGTMVCADKREWNRAIGPVDTVTKIGVLRADAVYATSGSSAISVFENGFLVEKYSVQKDVSSFFREKSAKHLSLELIQEFAIEFSSNFTKASKLYGTNMEASPGAADDVVSEIDFIYLDASGIEQMQVLLLHQNGTSTVEPFHGHVYVAGETNVTLHIIRPQQYFDNHFIDLLNDQRLARIWLQGTSAYPETPQLADALYSAHLLIRATAERNHYLSQGPSLVGVNCDCGVLRADGFKWIENNFDTRTTK